MNTLKHIGVELLGCILFCLPISLVIYCVSYLTALVFSSTEIIFSTIIFAIIFYPIILLWNNVVDFIMEYSFKQYWNK